MAQIKQKLATIERALQSLSKSIELLYNYEKQKTGNEDIALALRDSVIQRFEYCTDLFWKVVKIYLEEVEKVTLAAYSPAGIIRSAVEARIITEAQGLECLEMINSRNLTSHIYREEIAQNIVSKVPAYFSLMGNLVQTIHKRIY